jgi:PAS domain S-box-containing protein
MKGSATPLRVLLVEDSENDALLLLRELRRGGYEPEHQRVCTHDEMERALGEASEGGRPWQIVISDYHMPRFGAPDALDLLRELGYDTPFVVVSGKIGEDAAVAMLRAGAQDYVAKENMARLCAAIERELREAEVRRGRKHSEEALRFLAESGAELSSSLDYRATLAGVARLAVPHLADWCAVDVLEEDGGTRRLAVEHQDPAKVALALELQERYPTSPDAPSGLPNVLRTGRSEFYPEITSEMVEAAARDEEHLRILREIGFTSAIIVPMIARGRTLGAITLVSAESGRHYERADLELAEELARRAALAVDNARLYDEAHREIAERERAQEELRNSRDQLDIILRGVAEGITAQDPSGSLIYANEAAARIVGYPSAEALLKAPLQELMSRFEVADESRNPFPLDELPGRRALRGERAEALLCFHEVATGEERWSVVGATPVFDEEGRVRFAVNIFRDITERRRAEEALRQSEERFRATFEQAAVGVAHVSLEGRWLRVNQKLLEIVGYSGEELLRMTFQDITHRDDLETDLEQVRRLLAGEIGTYSLEKRYIKKDGSIVWINLTVSLVRDPNGAPEYFIGVIEDISERKRAEGERSQIAAIVESSDDAILGKTLEGIITSWNRAAERLYGYSAEEAVGQSVTMLVPPDRPEEVPEILRKVRQGERVERLETVRVTKGGEQLDVSLTVSPIRDPEGNIVGASTIARDVTELKRAQERIIRQARQAALRADVSAALGEGGALQSILQRCTESMVRNLDAAFVRIWTLNEEENLLELQASAGMYTHLDGPHSRVPVGSLKIGLIAHERQSHLTNDVLDDPRVSDKEWAQREGMVAFAGYPLIVEDRLVGVVAMFAREELAEDVIEALASVADAIAQGIQRKRAEEALRGAREAERNRIARDLHDDILQDIVYALQEIQIMQALSEDGGAQALEETAEALRRSVEGLRGAIFELRLRETLGRSFVSSLEVLVDLNRRMSRRGYELELTVEDGFPRVLSERAGRELVRIVQEALANVRRHAEARHARVRLWREGDLARVEVADDGRGFDAGSPGVGVGQQSMRQRARELGGVLEVESQPGRGTRVRFKSPVSRLVGE